MPSLPGPQRVAHALRELGLAVRVVELPDSTRTAKAAAEAIGCTVGEIAKSLVFRASRSGKPVLAVMSGSNRADVEKLAALAGEPVEKADAAFVRQHTGYAIGGVPPVGHPQPLLTLLDEDLARYETVWAAAGSPFAVFEITPAALARATGASGADLKE